MLKQELNGRIAYIDGETGQAAIEPDDIILTAFQSKLEKQQEMKTLMETMKGQEDVTLDGRHMMVYCTIGSPEDVAAVLSNDGQDIGLFRSEFLYLYNKETEVGIMIETPASVMVAEELAREVDFFSVGTNDLTQYTLACDRQANDLGKFFDPHHPAVLRALKMAADAAHKAGI